MISFRLDAFFKKTLKKHHYFHVVSDKQVYPTVQPMTQSDMAQLIDKSNNRYQQNRPKTK